MSIVLFPFKLVFFTATAPFRVVRLPIKVLGVRGVLALALGVGIGLVVAPRTGTETRAWLRERYEEWQVQGGPGSARGLGADSDTGATTESDTASSGGGAARAGKGAAEPTAGAPPVD